MFYVIDDPLLARLKALAASGEPDDGDANISLLDALAVVEAEPLLGRLFWTKSDLVAEYRDLIQGKHPRNSDGTWFRKTAAFADPLREKLVVEMAGDVGEFCLGIRNDVETDLGLAAVESLQNAVLEALEEMGIDQADAYIFLSSPFFNEFFANLPPELIASGVQPCIHYVADKIRLELTEEANSLSAN